MSWFYTEQGLFDLKGFLLMILCLGIFASGFYSVRAIAKNSSEATKQQYVEVNMMVADVVEITAKQPRVGEGFLTATAQRLSDNVITVGEYRKIKRDYNLIENRLSVDETKKILATSGDI